MTDVKRATQAILERFAPQLRWTVNHVMNAFNLSASFYDDLRQEAEIRLITYAGLMQKESWGAGRLAKWEELSSGDNTYLNHLVSHQLRIDLIQIVSRKLDYFSPVSQSVDVLISEGAEPSLDGWEDRQINAMDNSRLIEQYRNEYPMLFMTVLDDTKQDVIASKYKITTRTVRNRLTAEKRNFIISYLRSSGLAIEGNETVDELEEAYNHVSQNRRLNVD